MKKDQLVKVITLGTFILLIAGFVVFKSGGLDTFFEKANDATVPLVKSDTIQQNITDENKHAVVSDTNVPAPPLPPPHSHGEGFETEPVPEPSQIDSIHIQRMMSTSKSTIAIDQGEFIWELDSFLNVDSPKDEE